MYRLCFVCECECEKRLPKGYHNIGTEWNLFSKDDFHLKRKETSNFLHRSLLILHSYSDSVFYLASATLPSWVISFSLSVLFLWLPSGTVWLQAVGRSAYVSVQGCSVSFPYFLSLSPSCLTPRIEHTPGTLYELVRLTPSCRGGTLGGLALTHLPPHFTSPPHEWHLWINENRNRCRVSW